MTCSSASAQARASADDAAATHAYLEATIAMKQALAAEVPAELQGITAFGERIKADCPDVLSGAPPQVKDEPTNESDFQISLEVTFATLGAAEDVQHHALARYATTVRRLRWSNLRLTKLLRSLATEQAVQSAIPSPNLCADLRFWVTSGYTAVSPGTKEFQHRLTAVSSITVIEHEPHEPPTNFLNPQAVVAYRLKPYENRADRQLAEKALPSGKKTESGSKRLLEAAARVYAVIGRPVAPTG